MSCANVSTSDLLVVRGAPTNEKNVASSVVSARAIPPTTRP